ncbi:hypothetical protein K402DRAFT_115523 [Aulographum hederae CBS 113979]|uniref:Uncharacterized protein n=1 Tax=Aulographum hederae CBS 113979 TaxID=1176131 RepID=A0A6G1GVK8_9PEZI|nr:hypothetical protein K402DRAFT_115523 [Aulographum hederae CBS 113979]
MAPTPKQKAPKGSSSSARSGGSGHTSAITDARFSNLTTDPRFRLPSRKNTQLKLDSRFKRIVEDDDFTKKASVDRLGRKIKADKSRRDLEKIYKFEDEEDEFDDDEEVRKELNRVTGKNYDPAREGGFSTSEENDSSESEDEDSEGEPDAEEDVAEGCLPGIKGQQEEEIPMGDATHRIALVNLDWDNIRAVDIMAVASSFLPEGGRIESVSVYPSEFGRERMEREAMEGPARELFAGLKRGRGTVKPEEITEEAEEDSDEEEARIRKNLQKEENAEDFDPTHLRTYQLQRLRYFYAVITTNSPTAASALMEALDGREYLSSANFFDLRFVPDDTSFEHDKPRDGDVCREVPEGYKPRDFVTDALTRSKVKLTWDDDDGDRKEILQKAFSRAEAEEMDLKAYIGSDSSDDEHENSDAKNGEDDSDGYIVGKAISTPAKEREGKHDKISVLRAALGLSAEPIKSSKEAKGKKPVGNMQITFSSGLSANKKKDAVFENEPVIEETTAEQYVRKEKERKARRREKAKAARGGVSAAQASEPAPERSCKWDQAEQDVTAGANDDDDPFNDPFFDDPIATSRLEAKKTRLADKAKKRAVREAESAANREKQEELELLMLDEDSKAGKIRHFDMNEIARAEKAKKKFKKTKRDKEAVREADKDDFSVDTHDPRFLKLFENHEFAIDPTNPRFKKTKGMEALLEEGRNKRARKDGREDDGGQMRAKKQKKQHNGENIEGGTDDLKRLVARVKQKGASVST